MLLLEFAAVFVTVFVPAAWFWRPSQQRLAIALRYNGIRSTRSGIASQSLAAETPLLIANTVPKAWKWLERLTHGRVAASLRKLLLQAAVSCSVTRLIGACAAIAVVVFAAAAGLGAPLLPGMALAVPMASIPLLVLLTKRNRRRAAFSRALPEAIEMMSRSLRAGHSMSAAISVLAEHAAEPLAGEFAEVFRKQNFGIPLRDALLAMAERVASQDLRVVITAILVQKDTGGNLAEILNRTVTLLRERQRLQREVRTHTAQGRITGWILCALPPVLLVVINIANPGYSHVLFVEATGRELLYTGAGLLVLGSLWIRSIVRKIEV